MPRVFALPPPYTEPRPLGARPDPAAGSVLLVLLEDEMDHGFEQAVELLRRMHPASPLAFWLPDTILEPHLRAVARAARWGVRAVCAGTQPGIDSLRPQLTDPAFLADEMVAYVAGCGVAMSLGASWLLHALVHGTARQHSIREVLEICGCTPRTSRRLFQRSAFPAPSSWFQMARALRAALAIQREPGTPLAEFAFRHAYPDVSTLSRSLLRAFSRRPTEIRRVRLGTASLALAGRSPRAHLALRASRKPSQALCGPARPELAAPAIGLIHTCG